MSSEVTEQYWLEEVYTPEIREAHRSGAFHIHDLWLLSPCCVSWDLSDPLGRGFRGVPGKVATEPAKHFGIALGQIVNFFYTLQGEAAGVQAKRRARLLARLITRVAPDERGRASIPDGNQCCSRCTSRPIAVGSWSTGRSFGRIWSIVWA